MSSYLVALTVGDWKCAARLRGRHQARRLHRSRQGESGPFPLEATKAILHYYNDYYGIKYPLAKLDQIAVPDFQAGAMENWGAIIYRETALLIDDKTASVRRQERRGRRHRARSCPPVVWRSCYRRLVGRHLAQRRFRHLDDAASVETWKPDWMVSQDVVENPEALGHDGVQNTRPIHQDATTRNEIEPALRWNRLR